MSNGNDDGRIGIPMGFIGNKPIDDTISSFPLPSLEKGGVWDPTIIDFDGSEKSVFVHLEEQDKLLEPFGLCATCPRCELITVEMLKTIWPNVGLEKLEPIADELNYSINLGLIDNHLRLSHFLGQMSIEAGPTLRLRENMIYTSVSALRAAAAKNTNANPQLAEKLVKLPNGPDKYNQIATFMYDNRTDLGNKPGDGITFIGRGAKQLTGRYNYEEFNKGYPLIWKEDGIDFIKNVELLETPKYGIRSGLWFWKKHGLNSLADKGMTETVSNNITKIINRWVKAPSPTLRWQAANRIFTSGVFKNVCFNTKFSLNNKKAYKPYHGFSE